VATSAEWTTAGITETIPSVMPNTNLVFGTTEGINRGGRPCREWIDDIVGASLRYTNWISQQRPIDAERRLEACSGHQRAMVQWLNERKNNLLGLTIHILLWSAV